MKKIAADRNYRMFKRARQPWSADILLQKLNKIKLDLGAATKYAATSGKADLANSMQGFEGFTKRLDTVIKYLNEIKDAAETESSWGKKPSAKTPWGN